MALASSHPSQPMTGGLSSSSHNLTVPATMGALNFLQISTISAGCRSA